MGRFMKEMAFDDDSVVLNINPKVYPIETIYSASYVFLGRAYILLDGDPAEEIIVKLKPKESEENKGASRAILESLGGEFLNELINYADYKKRAEDTKNIREALLQRALITSDPRVLEGLEGSDAGGEDKDDKEFEKLIEELNRDDESLDDPQGIAVPWEEKYGKNSEPEKRK
jgi:His-Xaa-Ser system protein HxsD